MARVLVATPEPIAQRLAGPAIRAAHIARVLDRTHDVVLASSSGPSVSPIDGRPVAGLGDVELDDLDAAVVQGSVLLDLPVLEESDVPIAIDWFDPFHTEALHRGGADRIRRMDLIEGARQTLLAQAARGDFFRCSNQVQLDHWLGWLAAAGRLNHLTHDVDPSFDHLIAIAPFGVANEPIRRTRPIRSAYSSIGPDDPVVLWAGGLHDWLDPLTIVEAMPIALDRNPDTKLVFLAGPHPNTSIENMGIRGETITRARQLKLFSKSTIFVNQWIDYEERLSWLADADVGVVAHRAHLESHYAHRTRLFDHMAVGLPTVATGGETVGELMRSAHAARLVEPEDVEAMGAAIAEMVADETERDAMRRAANSLAASLSWETTLAPLVAWVDGADCAADRRAGASTGVEGGIGASSGVERMVGRARMHLDDGGPRQVLGRALAAGRRRLGR